MRPKAFFFALTRRLRELNPANAFPSRVWNDGRKLHVVTFYTEGPPFEQLYGNFPGYSRYTAGI